MLWFFDDLRRLVLFLLFKKAQPSKGRLSRFAICCALLAFQHRERRRTAIFPGNAAARSHTVSFEREHEESLSLNIALVT